MVLLFDRYVIDYDKKKKYLIITVATQRFSICSPSTDIIKSTCYSKAVSVHISVNQASSALITGCRDVAPREQRTSCELARPLFFYIVATCPSGIDLQCPLHSGCPLREASRPPTGERRPSEDVRSSPCW